MTTIECDTLEFSGFTQSEVAEFLGISRSYVWKLEQSALRKIRVALEREAAGRQQSVRQWLRGE